jgi:D-sedoheptulose 7-phosphate isomerase
MEVKAAIHFPERYRSDLLGALEKTDLHLVTQAINAFVEARTLNRRIFVSGNGVSATFASQFLCDLVKGTGYNLSARFRILTLTDQHPSVRTDAGDIRTERVFVDQLQNFAESGDVVMGISSGGSATGLLRALEYAGCIGSRTIALTGPEGSNLASVADLHVLVPASQTATVEDGLMIVSHMIGSYFQRFEAA